MSEMWSFVIFAIWLGILAAADLRRKSVPVWMLAVGGALVAIMWIFKWGEEMQSVSALLLGLLPGMVFLFISWGTKKAGTADGVVLLLLGLRPDYRECAASFAFGLFMMSIAILLLLVMRKVKRNSKIPYLPFLWMGYMVQALAGWGGTV